VESIVVEATAPLVGHPRDLRKHRQALRAGGVDALLATVGSIETFPDLIARLAAWSRFAREPTNDARLARSVREIAAAKARGELAVVLHMQGAGAIGTTTEGLDLLHLVGVRVMQLAYNYANQLGDGCLEPRDGGLSELGRAAVRRMGELHIALDISHTGERTSRELIDLATAPVVASHANARAIHNHPRNLSDDLIRAVAGTGGVIGMCAFEAFITDGTADIDRLLDHACYIADLVGAQHVGVGLDFSDEDENDYDYFGYDPRYYPRPPWHWPDGIANFAEIANLPAALTRRGFSHDEVTGIMGGNFLGAFREVWGE